MRRENRLLKGAEQLFGIVMTQNIDERKFHRKAMGRAEERSENYFQMLGRQSGDFVQVKGMLCMGSLFKLPR